MSKKEKSGFIRLAKKTFSVITASLTGLAIGRAEALPSKRPDIQELTKGFGQEKVQKKNLRRKLVLKLNIKKPEESILSMHASHSSHSSHASHVSYTPPPGHSSHSSHSSHYSSSPSYTPSAPTYQPSNNPDLRSSEYNNRPNVADTSNYSAYLPHYVLGSRVLRQGCIGTDVRQLQLLLIKMGFVINADGVYGESTKEIVMRYQVFQSLVADGVVGKNTLKSIQSSK